VKPLVHRTLVHCNQRPRSAPNRAIGRQYFAAAYGLLGWTGMSDEAAPLVSEIAPVNVERVRFRVVAEGYPGTSLRPCPADGIAWPCAPIALAEQLDELRDSVPPTLLVSCL
jgi:hypothetical protein